MGCAAEVGTLSQIAMMHAPRRGAAVRCRVADPVTRPGHGVVPSEGHLCAS